MIVKKQVLTALLIVVTLITQNSIKADSLVSINDLTFHSVLEENVFHAIFNDEEIDFLSLYLCSDSTINYVSYLEYKNTLEKTFNVFKEYSEKNLKNTKKVKKLYAIVHDNMFDVYRSTVRLSNVFNDKEYNCVTGSMIYVLAFDKYNIPYEIHELPNHVYLQAYPNEKSITVETTNPIKGVIIYDHAFKSKFVNYLRESKTISTNEMASKSVDELFNEHFTKPVIITREQLASLQYSNEIIKNVENQDFLLAFYNCEKAYYLYPNEKNSFMLLITLSLAIEKMNMTDVRYSRLLAKICRFEGKLITSDDLLGSFSLLTERQLHYEGNTKLYSDSFKTIIASVKDSLTHNEISFIYNLEMGNYHYTLSHYKESKPFLEKAYGLEIKYNANKLKGCSITTTLEDVSLFDKLDIICDAMNLSYQEEDASITIIGKGCE